MEVVAKCFLTECLTGLEKQEVTKEKLACLYKKAKIEAQKREVTI